MFNNGAPQAPWGLQSLMPQQPMQPGLLAPPQQMPQQKGLLDQMGGLGGLLSMASMMRKAPAPGAPGAAMPPRPGLDPTSAMQGMGMPQLGMPQGMPGGADPGMFASLMRLFGGQ